MGTTEQALQLVRGDQGPNPVNLCNDKYYIGRFDCTNERIE